MDRCPKNREWRYHGLESADKANTLLPHKCRMDARFPVLTSLSRFHRAVLDRTEAGV